MTAGRSEARRSGRASVAQDRKTSSASFQYQLLQTLHLPSSTLRPLPVRLPQPDPARKRQPTAPNRTSPPSLRPPSPLPHPTPSTSQLAAGPAPQPPRFLFPQAPAFSIPPTSATTLPHHPLACPHSRPRRVHERVASLPYPFSYRISRVSDETPDPRAVLEPAGPRRTSRDNSLQGCCCFRALYTAARLSSSTSRALSLSRSRRTP